ncbi:MAG TPA: SGNH/GDSL hydrolase family protein [Acidimicrobiales bacterium]|nr:SGNH/GDSL hydrolase family protein [Acidimicrobiales bacterium]
MTRPPRARLRKLLIVLGLGAAALSPGACSRISATYAGPPPQPAGPRETYVAIGGAETLGFGAEDPRQTWTQILYRTAFPPRATMYVLATTGATVADALAAFAQQALGLKPTVVTVWLGLSDMEMGTPVNEFAQDARTLFRDLRRHGSTTVLVASLVTSATGSICSGADCGLISAYDDALAQAASATGAVLVNVQLGVVAAAARHRGVELVLPGLNGLTPEGQVVVAGLFAAALRHR